MEETSNKTKANLSVISGSDKGKELSVDKTRFIVGRRVGDLILSDNKVSAAHFALEQHRLGYILIDLDSTNGTKLNGKNVKVAVLSDCDEILVGATKIKFSQEIMDSLSGGFHSGKTEREIKVDDKNDSDLDDEELNVTGVKVKSSIAYDMPAMDESTSHGDSKKARFSIRVLSGLEEGAVFYLSSTKTVVGRVSADINLADKSISRKHLILEVVDENEVSLKDLSTKAGTFVNNRRVLSCKLKDGDKVQIGKTILELVLED